jgi:type IV pilus assembly protein PilM
MSLFNLQLNSLGINISDRFVKIIELKEKNKKIYLKAWNEQKIEEGVVSKGEIKNKQKLAETIIKAINESKGKITTTYANISLPENKIFFNNIKLYTENDKKIRGALEKELEKHVPIAIDELRYDYEIIAQNKQEKKMVVSVSSISQKIAEDYEEVAGLANIKLNCLETQSQSSVRAVYDQIDKSKSTLLLDLGFNNSSILLWHKKAIRFTTEISFCGEKINSLIAKKTKMTGSKVEKTKKIYGLENKKNKNPILNLIAPEASLLIKEIEQSLSYYDEISLEDKDSIKIILTGGTSRLKGLDKYIQKHTGIETKIARPFKNIKLNKNQLKIKEKDLEMLIPIGLSLKDIKNVNR